MLNSRNSFVLLLISSLFIAFSIAIQLPAQIYWGNYLEFSLSLYSMLPTFFTAFLALVIILCLPMILPFKQWQTSYPAVIATLSVLIWFNISFMFGHYGAFDGRGMNIDIYSFRSLFELTIWGALVCISCVFAKRILNQQLFVIMLLFILNVTFTAVQAYDQKGTSRNRFEHDYYVQDDLVTFSTQKRNVIHIVLDNFQSSMLEELIRSEPMYLKKLDGFIFYQDAISHYPATAMSIPSMLTGELYENMGDRDKFIKQKLSQTEFISSLRENGFRLDFHGFQLYCDLNIFDSCTSFISPSNQSWLLLDYSVFRAVPDVLKPFVYQDDQWMFAHYFSKHSYFSSVSGMAYLTLAAFVDAIKTEDIQPTYKFFHSLITHNPWLLDEHCVVHDETSASLIKGQSICAMKQVVKFIEKLKRMNVYDNTMIVISSDHGAGLHFENQNIKLLNERNVTYRIQSSSLSTLMIKPFERKGEMITSHVPAALSDIPNTLLSGLQLENIAYGTDINKLKESTHRIRKFYYYNWSDDSKFNNNLPPLTVYDVDGNAHDAASWSMDVSDKSRILSYSNHDYNRWYEVNTNNNENMVNGEMVLGPGWAALEPLGAWTDGNQAILFFTCPISASHQPFFVDLMLNGFVASNHQQVNFNISLNGDMLTNASLNIQNQRIEMPVKIPANTCRDQQDHFSLLFHIENPASPSDLGLSQDIRELGVGFSGYRYRKVVK